MEKYGYYYFVYFGQQFHSGERPQRRYVMNITKDKTIINIQVIKDHLQDLGGRLELLRGYL